MSVSEPRHPAGHPAQTDPVLPDPSGPVDPTVAPQPVREGRAAGLVHVVGPGLDAAAGQVTQALGICFTAEGLAVMVTWDEQRWTFPGGSVEPGETIEATLVREVAEEACAIVDAYEYLACQHVADPLHPGGAVSYYQTRWWARVTMQPWQPRHEMTGRRLVPPDRVLATLFWSEKAIARRLLDLAMVVDQRHRVRTARQPA